MNETMHWSNDPAGEARALAFFRRHPRGVKSYGTRTTPGLPGKFAGEPGTPGQTYFVVVTGDGVHRWCGPGKHWEWDGRKFAAAVCDELCQ